MRVAEHLVADGIIWLLLTYRVPREPSAARVYVWRKLKKLGSVSVQDAIWMLPFTPRTLEQFRWLADEILQMGGQAHLWEARSLSREQETDWVGQFQRSITASYQQMLKALNRPRPDIAALSRQYQQALAQDYFQCEIGKKVRQTLLSATSGADERSINK